MKAMVFSGGRSICPYCHEVAHKDPLKIRDHMKTCQYSPFHIDIVEAFDLEDKLGDLYRRDRRVIAILPWEYAEGEDYRQVLTRVKIIHVSIAQSGV